MTQIIWNKRVVLSRIVGTFIIIGLLVALFSPVQYQAEASLLPESQATQGSANSLLQQYGGLLGISGVGNFGDGVIPPELYPDIVQSLPYQIELMQIPLSFSEYDTTATAFVFFDDIYTPSVFSYIKSYTLGLPSKIIAIFKEPGEKASSSISEVDPNSIISLSRAQMGIVNNLRERITVEVSQGTGVITYSAELPDPQAAAEISRIGIRLLKEQVKEYRTQKAQKNLEFVQEQLNKAQIRFEEAQQKLAEFRDSNVNLATAKAKSREQELQSKYDLTFNLYNTLSQRMEQAKLTLQEETPVFTIIQPVSVPLHKSSPNRKLILLISLVLGIIVSLAWVLINEWWSRVKYTSGES